MTYPSLFIKNAIIHLNNGQQMPGHLYIHNGKINSYRPSSQTALPIEPCTKIIDAKQRHLIPGFIDTHIHGAAGVNFMDANDNTIDTLAKTLARDGTTSFLATTMTQHREKIELALTQAGKYKNKEKQAEFLGVHLEGPFIAKEKAGAQPKEHVIHPNRKLFEKWQQLASERIKIVTMAPELDPDGTFISSLVQNGCIVSAGHTNATFSNIKRATKFGLNQLTHLGNRMNTIHHREVGPVGAAFLLSNLYVELIADEIHLSKEMLEIIYQQVGSDFIILISDAISAKDLEDGIYNIAGQQVTVKDNKALLPTGQLAGSTLSLQQAAQNMLKLPSVTLYDIIKMTAINPAKQLGVYNKKGSISIGKDADLLLVDDYLNIDYTICKGWVIT